MNLPPSALGQVRDYEGPTRKSYMVDYNRAFLDHI